MSHATAALTLVVRSVSFYDGRVARVRPRCPRHPRCSCGWHTM